MDPIAIDDKAAAKQNEYEMGDDTSDEEDLRNTVGNIPMNWYDDYPHLGYNWVGKKILKPRTSDQLDEFMKRMEDPNFWCTVKDGQTSQNVILSDEDLVLIERIQTGKVPDAEFDEYKPWVEWFTSEVEKMPLRAFPEHKRSFLPSLSDKRKVSRLVHALKMGWIKPEAERLREEEEKRAVKFYALWGNDDSDRRSGIGNHIPAPKRPLPGHAESYNPPAEYLFDKKEIREWHKMAENEQTHKRKLHFVPQKFDSLRHVPAYPKFVNERFQRCLDLYLCPRGRKMRLNIEPEDLLPKLPSPKDLQPFPTVESIIYTGHSSIVRCISVEPSKGQYLLSGSDDKTVKVWEVASGRCLRTIQCDGVVRSVAWSPNPALSLVLVAADNKLLLINPNVGDSLVITKSDDLLQLHHHDDALQDKRVASSIQWKHVDLSTEQYKHDGIRIIIDHFKQITQVCWHIKGDYFASVMPDGLNRAVIIHQLSKKRSQMPFSKSKGLVQRVAFHPVRPLIVVALQRNIRIYDLVQQQLVKKLQSNARWISSLTIHPSGDHILIGTYDRKLAWFDLDLATTPYQTLRLHAAAVRACAFHTRYPMFASVADDRSLCISHGRVYSDLLQNPLLVPLKKIIVPVAVPVNSDFGLLDVHFHPTQPWVFASAADSSIRLYT